MPFPAAVKTIAALRKGPIARGAISSIVIRVAALALGFVQAILTARLLGPEGYGVVAVALSVVTIAATVATLGLGPLAVREVARLTVRSDWGALRGFLRFSTLSVLGVSCVTAAVIAALPLTTELFDPAFRTAIALAAPLIPLLALLFLFRGLCQGFGRVVSAQAPGDLLRPAIMATALGFLLATASMVSTPGYLAIAIGATLAGTLAAGLSLQRIVSIVVPEHLPHMAPRDWGLASAPFLGTAVLGLLLGEVNTLLLGWLAGPGEAGLFQPLARIAPVMLIGLRAVGIRYMSRVSELWEKGDLGHLERVTRLVTVTTTLFAAATCAAILAFAPWILAAFGKEFTANISALGWFAAAQMFTAACGPVGMLLTMSGYTGKALLGQLLGLAANLALGMWLIPEHGAHGAAQAMAGGVVVWNLVMLWSVRRDLGFDPSLLGALVRLIPRRH